MDLGDSISLSQLSMRQGVSSEFIYRLLPAEIEPQINLSELETVLADFLYRGYVETQRNATERVNNYDNLRVPVGFRFNSINGLSNEMIERLERAKPQTFSQVRKINGLTPSAISTVLIHLTSKKNQA
jgi:tRNA uridine 5-carboxymethylaminomethyl modification enzyme